MNTKDKIAVMQAFVDGKTVQYKDADSPEDCWEDYPNHVTPKWDWMNFTYRIKPKTRYMNVYEGNGVKSYWHSDKRSLEMSRCSLCIGYLEDKQDGSPYIFHQL